MTSSQSLEQKAAAAIGTKPFRGEIWEHAPNVTMGKGYANDNKPFDINTAHYLKPVFRAIKDPNVREVWIKKGVQALGTFTAEKSGSYFADTDPGDMIFYDCDIKAARDHAKSRLGAFLRSIPGLAGQIAEIENDDDISTKEFYLPGMTLRIWPLNQSSTQRMTLRYVIIHDAYLSGSTGMIGEAIARTTQHPHDKKIIIESQGSDEGDDFDRGFNGTNHGMLHVKCPLCGEGQPFDFERTRDDGTFSGFQRGPDELILLPDGGYNAVEVMRNTHYECFHCRGKWLDVPETRLALDKSSYYVSANPTANPAIVGFNWPNWINQRVRWGGDEVMMGYLNAKKADKEFGNKDPLKQWYQKRAAKTWSDKIGQQKARVLIGSHNIEGAVPNEVARMMQVDCQQDPDLSEVSGKSVIGHFWVTAYAVDKNARNIYQLARFYATSWKQWIDIRKALKIPNKNVAIDGGHWIDEVVEKAAVNWEIGTNYNNRGKPFKARTVWTVLRGNGTRSSFKHDDGIFRAFSQASDYEKKIIIDGTPVLMRVPVVEWSNLSIKNQLFAIRQGGDGKPVWHALSRDKLDALTQEKEKGSCTYEQQIANEYKTRERGRDVWKEANPNVHYNDDDCMCLVQCGRGGLVGHIAVAEERVNES